MAPRKVFAPRQVRVTSFETSDPEGNVDLVVATERPIARSNVYDTPRYHLEDGPCVLTQLTTLDGRLVLRRTESPSPGESPEGETGRCPASSPDRAAPESMAQLQGRWEGQLTKPASRC